MDQPRKSRKPNRQAMKGLATLIQDMMDTNDPRIPARYRQRIRAKKGR